MLENLIVLDKKIHHIKSGESMVLPFSVSMTEAAMDNCYFRLRLKGRNGIHPAWLYEGGMPYLYRDINDSLSQDTQHSRFSLKITAKGEEFPRRAYYKILCPPMINSQYPVPASEDYQWQFHGTVKVQDFTVLDGGRGEVRFECFWKKDGIDARDISRQPDETVIISLPQGSTGADIANGRGGRNIEGVVPIRPETAAILVTITVKQAQGTVWLEDLVLENDTGFNILPAFEPANPYHPFMNWMGENLSHREWCEMKVILNGREMEMQELFQRCYAGAENEIDLPDGLIQADNNELELWNVSDYFSAAPYDLCRVELIWEERHPIRIISAPMHVLKNQSFCILVKTEAADTKACLAVDCALQASEQMVFQQPGLHVWELQAGEQGSHMAVTVSAGQDSHTVWIERIVDREEDGVLLGSGDAVYIPQRIEEMERFLCWYLSSHLGNMITFRPVYRWCGSRMCRPAVWKRVTQLCNELGLYYCHMIDGRELPGINANPTNAMLEGPCYVGNQGHERDGAFYYWLQPHWQKNDILFEEISRKVENHPDFRYRTPIIYGEEDVYFNFSPRAARNMEEGAGQFVEQVGYSLKGVKRHSGPSTLFKYFYQAGVEVCGAELMYGPQEVILAALRGASIAYNRESFTAHLAVQWSTTPHDSAAHCRRFRLALFISYLQGCHHINTEEGLYRMEEYFTEYDRFSAPCVSHAAVQREFLNFIETHSRRGRLISPIAILHGCNDGWVCFTRRNVWSQDGEAWRFGTPEESWDLITVFYPDSVLDAIYRHPCPDSPQGYYSRTPYGTVDILPAEASLDKYSKYSHMAFLGFHTAQEQQVDRLREYVENGGTLLLGWCHLFTDTDRYCALTGLPHPLEASELTGVKLRGFLPEQDGMAMGEIEILSAQVSVLDEKNGTPLLLRHSLGRGTVYLVNAREYPASPAVRDIYLKILTQFGEEAVEENAGKGWMSGKDTVGTAVYEREDGYRVIYAVNTHWWGEAEPETFTELLLGGAKYQLQILRDVITIATIKEDVAVVTSDSETEILDIYFHEDGLSLRIQGAGYAKLRICCQGKLEMMPAKDNRLEYTAGEAWVETLLNGEATLRFCRRDCIPQ